VDELPDDDPLLPLELLLPQPAAATATATMTATHASRPGLCKRFTSISPRLPFDDVAMLLPPPPPCTP
jgi:hypothetical protein